MNSSTSYIVFNKLGLETLKPVGSSQQDKHSRTRKRHGFAFKLPSRDRELG